MLWLCSLKLHKKKSVQHCYSVFFSIVIYRLFDIHSIPHGTKHQKHRYKSVWTGQEVVYTEQTYCLDGTFCVNVMYSISMEVCLE